MQISTIKMFLRDTDILITYSHELHNHAEENTSTFDKGYHTNLSKHSSYTTFLKALGKVCKMIQMSVFSLLGQSGNISEKHS